MIILIVRLPWIKELFTKTVDKKLKELKQSENENDDEDIIQISDLNEIIMETAKTALTKPKVRQPDCGMS